MTDPSAHRPSQKSIVLSTPHGLKQLVDIGQCPSIFQMAAILLSNHSTCIELDNKSIHFELLGDHHQLAMLTSLTVHSGLVIKSNMFRWCGKKSHIYFCRNNFPSTVAFFREVKLCTDHLMLLCAKLRRRWKKASAIKSRWRIHKLSHSNTMCSNNTNTIGLYTAINTCYSLMPFMGHSGRLSSRLKCSINKVS